MSVPEKLNSKHEETFLDKLKIDIYDPALWTNRFKLYLFFTNFILLAISIVLFVVGILYLTAFKYEYDYTQYSISFIGGFYLTVGIIGFFFIAFNLFALCTNRSVIIIATSVILIFLFFVIFVIGVVALGVNQEESLRAEIQGNLADLITNYNETDKRKLETRKMDWIQQKYSCCGITESSDWRMYYQQKSESYFQTVYPGQSQTGSNYFDYTPDSCCIDEGKDCGKRFNQFIDSKIKAQTINVNGCQMPYQKVLSKDLNFLGGVGVMLSCIVITLSAILLIFYAFVRKKSD